MGAGAGKQGPRAAGAGAPGQETAAESGRVEIGYEPVMSELVTPRERNYSKTHAPAKAEAAKTKATAAS